MIMFSAASLLWLLTASLSAIGCGLTIWVAHRYQVGIDGLSGVQRLHRCETPRLGGLPIIVSFAISLLLLQLLNLGPQNERAPSFLAVLLPTFAAGVAEDVTGKVGARTRLLVTMLSAAVGAYLLGAVLTRVDLPGLDALLKNHILLALTLTLVAAGGIPHALNIIDGCNGLSSGASLFALVGIGALAWKLGDPFLAYPALIASAAVLGFMVWNIPFGKIFLGDAGAYSLGLLIAELSILLVVRHPQVSAWFPLILMIHPVWEVVFSCLRRAQHSYRQMFLPDAKHLHQLVYKRISIHLLPKQHPAHQALASSLTSAAFATLYFLFLIFAMLSWSRTIPLMLGAGLFIVQYTVTYRWLSHFDLERMRRYSALQKKRGNELVRAYNTVRDSMGEIGRCKSTANYMITARNDPSGRKQTTAK